MGIEDAVGLQKFAFAAAKRLVGSFGVSVPENAKNTFFTLPYIDFCSADLSAKSNNLEQNRFHGM